MNPTKPAAGASAQSARSAPPSTAYSATTAAMGPAPVRPVSRDGTRWSIAPCGSPSSTSETTNGTACTTSRCSDAREAEDAASRPTSGERQVDGQQDAACHGVRQAGLPLVSRDGEGRHGCAAGGGGGSGGAARRRGARGSRGTAPSAEQRRRSKPSAGVLASPRNRRSAAGGVRAQNIRTNTSGTPVGCRSRYRRNTASSSRRRHPSNPSRRGSRPSTRIARAVSSADRRMRRKAYPVLGRAARRRRSPRA